MHFKLAIELLVLLLLLHSVLRVSFPKVAYIGMFVGGTVRRVEPVIQRQMSPILAFTAGICKENSIDRPAYVTVTTIYHGS